MPEMPDAIGWLCLVLLICAVAVLLRDDCSITSEDDDAEYDDDEYDEDVDRLISDLTAEIAALKEELACAERTCVIEGIIERRDCFYWNPTIQELRDLRQQYPGRFHDVA